MTFEELIENLVYAAARAIGDNQRHTLVAMSWSASRLCLRYGVPEWRLALWNLDARLEPALLARMDNELLFASHGSRAGWAQA